MTSRIIFFFWVLPLFSFAQKKTAEDIALDYVMEHHSEWGLKKTDISDLAVNYSYRSRHNGLRHVFLQQQYRGIPVFNALAGIHVSSEGKVLVANHRFLSDLKERANAVKPELDHQQALHQAATILGADMRKAPVITNQESEKRARYSGGSMSSRPMVMELMYYPMADASLRLSWSTTVVEPVGSDAWLMHIDALTGRALQQQNIVLTCSFGHPEGEPCTHSPGTPNERLKDQETDKAPAGLSLQDNARYRVYPIPVEAPNAGTRELVVDPADLTASPFGWHDTDGQEGPEFFYTRGNNTYTYLDVIPDDSPDAEAFPFGGPELNFDFPLDLSKSPDDYEGAVLTQMFYMNNIMHDFAYHYGFTEEAGNFQQNNYNRGGRGTDPVRAEAQDGSGLNNANFLTLTDGENGRMQMFLWAASVNSRLEINAPQTAGSPRFRYGTATFGPLLRTPVIGNVTPVVSNDQDPSVGCGTLLNAAQVNGNIALINRGGCTFAEKVLNAEAAGATAVIICNTQNDIINMSKPDSLPNPTIPVVSIASSSCDLLRSALDQGPVEATIEVPDYLDSGFDNGIVAHEYAHGISNRLVGGAEEPFCLFNDEQMGEGWSDFFTLVTSVRPEDTGRIPRGIGSFVLGNNPRGPGIRRQPYSTDFSVNNQTYDDIIGTFAPHPLGEIWAVTLWDLYWALVDKYGYDPDLYTGTGGNNIAVQLVMDGMKLLTCEPGFIDGRDAIIAADFANNNGANECLIWDVFARRGLGASAVQGSSRNRNDNIEAYDPFPLCVKELKIEKSSTPLIEAGDTFRVDITVRNDRDVSLSEVVVTDLIPEGATAQANSFDGGEEVLLEGNEITFTLGTLAPGEIVRLSYSLVSDPGLRSELIFADDMESGAGGWRLLSREGTQGWRLSERRMRSGERAWHIPNTANSQDQSLQLLSAIDLFEGTPVLRFYQAYEIQPGLDGGVVETSTDGGFNWNILSEDRIFRNPYIGRLAPGILGNAKREAYWGENTAFTPTYIDLSDFVGGQVNFRFRFGSNQSTGDEAVVTEGWYIDDVAVFDMINYATEACVTAAEGDQACTLPAERGTVVDPSMISTPTENIQAPTNWQVFPNPATTLLNVHVGRDIGRYRIELLSVDGKVIRTVDSSSLRTTIETDELQPGMYLIRLADQQNREVKKVVIKGK